MTVFDGKRPVALLILIAVQVLCTAFFMRDVLDDLRGPAEGPDDN